MSDEAQLGDEPQRVARAGWFLFGLLVGCFLTLGGAAWYIHGEREERRKRIERLLERFQAEVDQAMRESDRREAEVDRFLKEHRK